MKQQHKLHPADSASVKQFQHKLNFITFLKVGFTVVLLYYTVLALVDSHKLESEYTLLVQESMQCDGLQMAIQS